MPTKALAYMASDRHYIHGRNPIGSPAREARMPYARPKPKKLLGFTNGTRKAPRMQVFAHPLTKEERRSTSGYILFLLADQSLDHSKRQSNVATPSTEVEYIGVPKCSLRECTDMIIP